MPVGSDMHLPLKAICVGEVFGTPYRSSSQRHCDGSVFWCVSDSIYITDILVVFLYNGKFGFNSISQPLGVHSGWLEGF